MRSFRVVTPGRLMAAAPMLVAAMAMQCGDDDAGKLPVTDPRALTTADAGADAATSDASTVDVATDVTAPRPVAPASLGRTTTQRPTFRWRLPADADGARLTVCRDRACTDVALQVNAVGAQLRPTALFRPGVYFWRVAAVRRGVVSEATSATWEFVVPARDTPVDSTIHHIVDFNGDAYADVTTQFDRDNPEGVYLGSASGLARTPSTAMVTVDGEAEVEHTVAGDLDGDGFCDLVSLTTTGDDPAMRRVVLRRGGPSGLAAPVALSSSSPWPAEFVGAGDLDGDGYGDLVGIDLELAGVPARARVFWGAPTGLRDGTPVILTASPGDDLDARAVASLGDVNGDGRADLVFGAPGADGGAGRVDVWINGPDGAGAVTTLRGDGGRFGASVSVTGDYDGDGYADVAATSPFDLTVTDRSGVRVFRGGASGLAAPRVLPAAGSQSETIRVFPSADLNGDGYDDLVSWMHNEGRGPSAQVYYGSAEGVPVRPARVFYPQEYGSRETALMVQRIGDADRDGYDDLLVRMAPGEAVYARGTASGLTVGPSPRLTPP